MVEDGARAWEEAVRPWVLDTSVANARAIFLGSTMILRHGCVARPCCFGRFTHVPNARPWRLIASRVGENFALFPHGLRHARVPSRVCFRKPVFHESAGIAHLKGVEFGVTYLDCTKWDNAKYRKRNFFIRFGSVNETRSKNTPKSCSSNDKGPIYEERRLQVEELDEWRTQKPRSHDKSKPRHDKLNISLNQLKVGDKVLLDAADPRIATFELNGEIPLTVLSTFPYGTVEVIHPKFGTFKVNSTRLKPYFDKIDSRDEECKLLAPQ
ncbi:hypothetical protein GOBAR_AA04426 [Gossypium barbadense]|uniref:Uncharacterized protein n=1 Tax=Gossypium barbadense TaxID=3634 RepID=A0A2P5YKK3_GOSBA|nr:hypothetical protein GOBAR_AA04426 [Gossypium barbadense]